MGTTTYLGDGIDGRRLAIELPDVGEIVKVRAGTVKKNNLRMVVGRVIDHEVRLIGRGRFGVIELVVANADGVVRVGAGRLAEITADEAAAYTTA
ncbi:hypothetical protein [Streptomyces yaizuensis]|uniref:Uncharacterized protein n=1 Tax=Streptomyces yaizuensis TaxID=2989713 RepID=A0AA86M799_9ACTN|nr:hypothetical protein [Streptomyces sp. YSPA8]BDT39506.1 hypothetical protein SYYSPA8_36940 [Streptomyces sp. YSPA8]